jgi:hypothetical protein
VIEHSKVAGVFTTHDAMSLLSRLLRDRDAT